MGTSEGFWANKLSSTFMVSLVAVSFFATGFLVEDKGRRLDIGRAVAAGFGLSSAGGAGAISGATSFAATAAGVGAGTGASGAVGGAAFDAAAAAIAAASFCSVCLYSCAAREVYLASIFEDPDSDHPCSLKNVRALGFPLQVMIRSCSWDQESRFVERTKLMCTPMLRCVAEQSRQSNTPYGTEAQLGFLALQSKHILFSALRRISLKTVSRSRSAIAMYCSTHENQVRADKTRPASLRGKT
mmetsp:Transcript_30195/g.57988  ORF Transcript_30195/g.57988 Transcript_30195/m.57988 type:complete len:243 (-) Transcript_30195:250-978(-)